MFFTVVAARGMAGGMTRSVTNFGMVSGDSVPPGTDTANTFEMPPMREVT